MEMIDKRFVLDANPPYVEATFRVAGCIWADSIFLVGDFNHWNPKSHPFRQTRNGDWEIALRLNLGHAYQFRYLCDGTWQTDNHADGFTYDERGVANGLLIADPDFHLHSQFA